MAPAVVVEESNLINLKRQAQLAVTVKVTKMVAMAHFFGPREVIVPVTAGYIGIYSEGDLLWCGLPLMGTHRVSKPSFYPKTNQETAPEHSQLVSKA